MKFLVIPQKSARDPSLRSGWHHPELSSWAQRRICGVHSSRSFPAVPVPFLSAARHLSIPFSTHYARSWFFSPITIRWNF